MRRSLLASVGLLVFLAVVYFAFEGGARRELSPESTTSSEDPPVEVAHLEESAPPVSRQSLDEAESPLDATYKAPALVPEQAGDLEPFWSHAARLIDGAVQNEGSRLFSGRNRRPLLASLLDLEQVMGRPEGLPPLPWLQGLVRPATRGTTAAYAARLFPREWEAWIAPALTTLPVSGFETIGYLYGGLYCPDGVADLDKFSKTVFFFACRSFPGRIDRPTDDAIVQLAGEVLGRVGDLALKDTRSIAATEQSLAAMVLASRYETSEAVRERLEPCLMPNNQVDSLAHPGAVFGLSFFGGELAAERLRLLRDHPNYGGRGLLMAWAGELLDSDGSPISFLPPRGSQEGLFTAPTNTRGALEALRSSHDPELLNELIERVLDPEDESIDRIALGRGLINEGIDPTAGVHLMTELVYQDPGEHLGGYLALPFVLDAFDRTDFETLVLLESSLQAIQRDFGENELVQQHGALALEQLAAMLDEAEGGSP